jgi:6-pyruvoyl-tetrahydropterin synthase
VRTTVARRYQFTATHHVAFLPEPWSVQHEHRYTVEIRAAKEGRGLVVDTDLIDAAWKRMQPLDGDDLNDTYEDTTVEMLAATWFDVLVERVPEVTSVTVWEDDARWGRCER